jgi:sugar-specific transcriptional regulator TrmB
MTTKQRIIRLLLRIGLTESEAELYFTAYQKPQLTLAELQKKTGYSTASIYRAFDRLKNLGLITSSRDNWRKNVEAVSLKKLGEKVAKEQRKLRKVELELKQMDDLMNLTTLYDSLEEPVEILTNQNQIIDKAFEILSRPFDHFLAYGSSERLIEILGYDTEREFVNTRLRKGKSADVVLTEMGPYGRELIKTNDRELRNMKFKIDPANQETMTYIYDNEAVIWHKDSDSGSRAIVIKDPSLIKMHENMFSTLWSQT